MTFNDGLTLEQREDVTAALLAYWTSRDEAKIAQAARGVVDVGGRAGATSGGHLDRVAQLIARVCRLAGASPADVYYNAPPDDPMKRPGAATACTLPGYFRPTKQWDLVVYHERVPIVVIELKSQNGPSYGNNANNRAEEAVGSAIDLRRAIAAGLIPSTPWTGYVYVIEDDPQSRLERGQRDRGQFPKDRIFDNWSYLTRVRDLSRRLVEEDVYDAAWAVATTRPPQFDWSEPDPAASGYAQFIDSLQLHLASYFPEGPASDEAPLTLL